MRWAQPLWVSGVEQLLRCARVGVERATRDTGTARSRCFGQVAHGNARTASGFPSCGSGAHTGGSTRSHRARMGGYRTPADLPAGAFRVRHSVAQGPDFVKAGLVGEAAVEGSDPTVPGHASCCVVRLVPDVGRLTPDSVGQAVVLDATTHHCRPIDSACPIRQTAGPRVTPADRRPRLKDPSQFSQSSRTDGGPRCDSTSRPRKPNHGESEFLE